MTSAPVAHTGISSASAVYRLETYRFIEKYRRFMHADPPD
jgi:hypothetical protein